MDEYLARLQRNRFVSVGRAGLDLYPEPPGTRIEDAETFRADLGGSAGNIAVALARLGADVQLLTCFSGDAVGGFARNRLTSYGVDISLCGTAGGQARNTLAVAETRTEDCQSVIYRNGAADFELTENDVAAVDYAGIGGVIFSGTALALEPSRSAVFRGIALAREEGVPIILDMDYRAYSWSSHEEARRVYAEVAEASDIVVGNDGEFAVIGRNKADPREVAEELAMRNPSIVVFKMGGDGSITFAHGRSFRTDIFPVAPLKPFGAGDAFMGGFLTGLAGGQPLEEAVARGSAAAAMVVSQVGCASAMPTRAALEAFIAERAGAGKEVRKADARSAV